MRRPPPLSQLPFFPVTGGICLLAIVVTIAVFKEKSFTALNMNYLAFHGEPWRLMTSALPHVDWWHLIFNVYWIWILGSIVEAEFGHVRTAAFYTFLAVGSSAAEYAFASGGVGLSGIGYGLFGFLWVISRYDNRFRDAIDSNTIVLFVAWFFICIFLTKTNILPVGNYAHGAGAIFGALVGWAVAKESRWRIPAGAGIVILLGVTMWAATLGRPLVNFSQDGGDDLARAGYDALMREDNVQALKVLKVATSMRHVRAESWLNLGIAYVRAGDEKDAEAAFQKAKAMGLKPGEPESTDDEKDDVRTH